MDDCTLLPDLPRLLHRYQVTVTLPRAAGNDALLLLGAQAVVELAAATVAAEGLLTAWMSSKTVLSMVVELPCAAEALAAGAAAARALGGGQGSASVAAELAA